MFTLNSRCACGLRSLSVHIKRSKKSPRETSLASFLNPNQFFLIIFLWAYNIFRQIICSQNFLTLFGNFSALRPVLTQKVLVQIQTSQGAIEAPQLKLLVNSGYHTSANSPATLTVFE